MNKMYNEYVNEEKIAELVKGIKRTSPVDLDTTKETDENLHILHETIQDLDKQSHEQTKELLKTLAQLNLFPPYDGDLEELWNSFDKIYYKEIAR